ncbi:MAG: ABC transporter permease subunit [Rectinemataceae bacterium]|nr:ABC transporter permease subunit [Rectinemataceae bacterium]
MKISVISTKEIRSYLGSPVVYIVVGVFLLLSGAFFSMYLSGTSYADTSIRGFVDASQFLILLFAAMLSMRVIAEEKKLGTWEFLLTSPVADAEIIFSKFIASLAILTGMLALSLYYPLLLLIFGDPDIGPIATSYIGLFLLGSASLAVGIFASSVTANQIVAAVLSLGILVSLWFLGSAGAIVGGPVGSLLSYVSLADHFTDFARGIINTQHVIYYASVTTVFLYLSVRSIEAGRWY